MERVKEVKTKELKDVTPVWSGISQVTTKKKPIKLWLVFVIAVAVIVLLIAIL